MTALLRTLMIALVLAPAIPVFADDAAAASAPPTLLALDVEFVELDQAAAGDSEASAEALIERVRELQNEGKLHAYTRFRTTTLVGQQAQLQIGREIGIVSGQTIMGGGRSVNNYTRQPFGTLVKAQCNVEESGSILIDLSFERSEYEEPAPAASGTVAVAEPRTPDKRIVTAESTFRVEEGKTHLIHGIEQAGGARQTQLMLLVTARVVSPTGPGATGR